MSKVIVTTGLDKDGFEKYLKAVCETIMRNKDMLYQHYTDKTRCNDIIIKFPMRCDEVATMELYTQKMVYLDEENIELK